MVGRVILCAIVIGRDVLVKLRMNFLPRRRGQSFGGFANRMATRPRSRRGFMIHKAPAETSYIQTATAPISLAAGVLAVYPLLIASDTPDKSIVTNLAANAAQCENNTRLLKGSFIQFAMISETVPCYVTLWLYMNSKASITPPANSTEFSALPLTEDQAQLREKTIIFKQFALSTTDYRILRIPLTRRSGRNNFMNDASILNLVLHNRGAGAIDFHAFGRIRTLEG